MSGKRLECPELRGCPCTRDDVAQLSVRDRGEAAASSAAPPPVPLGPVLSANQNLNLQHLGPIWVANCYRLRHADGHGFMFGLGLPRQGRNPTRQQAERDPVMAVLVKREQQG